jgi:hypothetical protein
MVTNEVADAVFDIGDDGTDELPSELLDEFDIIIGAGMREWASNMERSLVDPPTEHLADMPLVASLGGRIAMTAVIGQQRLSTSYKFRGHNRPIVIN